MLNFELLPNGRSMIECKYDCVQVHSRSPMLDRARENLIPESRTFTSTWNDSSSDTWKSSNDAAARSRLVLHSKYLAFTFKRFSISGARGEGVVAR